MRFRIRTQRILPQAAAASVNTHHGVRRARPAIVCGPDMAPREVSTELLLLCVQSFPNPIIAALQSSKHSADLRGAELPQYQSSGLRLER